MKIAFLIQSMYGFGGMERVTANLANSFSEDVENEVSIICICKQQQDIIKYELSDKIQVIYLNGNSFFAPLDRLTDIFRVYNFLKKNTYDIVLGISIFPSIILSFNPNKAIKTIGCEHFSYHIMPMHWQWLRNMTYKSLNALVSLTNADRKNLLKNNSNVFVIPNAISFKNDKKATLENKTIISVGRIAPEKGFDLLIEAFADFCAKNSDWKLKIIGNAPNSDYKKALETLIKTKNIENRVQIESFTSQIKEKFLESSVYVMTSRNEGFPMVLLEAATCGLPLISYDCPTGPSEIIKDGENGYLIPFNNKEMLVEKLLYLCKNFDKRKEMGAKAEAIAEEFSPEVIKQKWYALFEELNGE